MTAPHILTLTTPDEYDPDCPNFWDEASLTCPHDPPTPTMECATWGSCGCPSVLAEQDDGRDWPCPKSATGVHRYFDGEPSLPVAECWPSLYTDSIWEEAADLELPPGEYTVHPWWWRCVGLRLDLLAWVFPEGADTDE